MDRLYLGKAAVTLEILMAVKSVKSEFISLTSFL